MHAAAGASIRAAAPADTGQIRAIAQAAYAKYVPRLNREPAPMHADFAAHVAAHQVVVIEHDGALAGYMVAWPEPDAYFVDNLAVSPAQQGHGLGRRLLDRAIAEARRLCLPAVRLHPNVAMTENLAIYEHVGFVETHRGERNGYHRVYLRLDLSTRDA